MSDNDNTKKPKQSKQSKDFNVPTKGLTVGFEILPQQSSSTEAFMAITAHPTTTTINLRKTKLKHFSMQIFRAEEIYGNQTAGNFIEFSRSVPLKKYDAEPGSYTVVGHYIEPIMGQNGMSANGYVYGRKDRRNFAIPVELVILPETEEAMGFAEYISFQFEKLREMYSIGDTGLFYNGKLTIEQLSMDQIWDQLIKKGWAQPKKKK